MNKGGKSNPFDDESFLEDNAKSIESFTIERLPTTKFSLLDALSLSIANTKYQKGSVILTLGGIILTSGFLSYLLISSFVLTQLGLEGIQDYFWWVFIASLIICFVGINYSIYMIATRRAYELGTFRALGGKWQHVLKILLLDSILIGLVGGFLGVISGVLTGFYVLSDGHGVQTVFELFSVSKGQNFLFWSSLLSLGVAISFTLIATAYPFLSIILRSPSDAIRSEL